VAGRQRDHQLVIKQVMLLQPVTEDGSDMEDLIQSAGQTLVGRI
jgi:hypothetical protein